MLDCETIAFIEEYVRLTSAVSASPGFTWGDSGAIKNAYLLNDSGFSNKAGRLCPVNGQVVTMFGTCENVTTGKIELRRRVGAVFTTLATLDFAGTRKKVFQIPTPPDVSIEDELVAFVTNDAQIKTPVCGIIIQGSLI